MKFTSTVTSGIAIAMALLAPAKADFYANFFDDTACSVNGGIGVDIRNPGCLSEAGRGSVYIPNDGLGTTGDNQYCLVITSGDGSCSCQNVGYDFTATGFCKTLNPSDQSYRFISGACASDNC